jgi:hypothetical protein
VSNTSTTDPRSQHNRVGRRGGQLLTRALGSSYRSACPVSVLPVPLVPDGCTICRNQPIPAERVGTAIFIPVTNMFERLNEEIKRRTHVVRIFPNAESCRLRLVRALAVETHENRLEQHRYLNMDDLREYKKEVLRLCPTPDLALWQSAARARSRTVRAGAAAAAPFAAPSLTAAARGALPEGQVGAKG